MLRLKSIYHNVGNVYIFQNRSFHLVRRSTKSSTEVWNVLTVHINIVEVFYRSLRCPVILSTTSSGAGPTPSTVFDPGAIWVLPASLIKEKGIFKDVAWSLNARSCSSVWHLTAIFGCPDISQAFTAFLCFLSPFCSSLKWRGNTEPQLCPSPF